MACALRVSNLSKQFGSGRNLIRALDSVSFEVKEGEVFGLLGPNGAGKSTLISVICGLELADSGEANVLGMDVVRQRRSVQQAINIVSGFSEVLTDMSVTELLRYYGMLYSIPLQEQRIRDVIECVGLAEYAGVRASLLSSGLRQRLFIAKGLLNAPRLILLDEPTVGLDVASAIQVRTLIKRLRADGVTVILTTHYMREAEELCDRIALINEGKIVALGTVRELTARVKRRKVVEIQTTDALDLRERISRIPGVETCWYAGGILRAEVGEYRSIRAIAKALLEEDIKLDSIRIAEPSLEDVFIALANRSLDGGSG